MSASPRSSPPLHPSPGAAGRTALSLRVRLANAFPRLAEVEYACRALFDSLAPARSSYAHSGEDRWVLDALSRTDLSRGIYVDVGAWHPSRISNTYLFYRRGLRGVLVEPNARMVRLLRRFRPRDWVIAGGCGEVSEVRNLYVYSTSADSSFSSERVPWNEVHKRLRRVETCLVPVLPLDTILAPVDHDWVYFLSVDAEGLDDSVLRGATGTLRRTLFTCVEVLPTNPGMDARIARIMEESGFSPARRTPYNTIYRNQSPPREFLDRPGNRRDSTPPDGGVVTGPAGHAPLHTR